MSHQIHLRDSTHPYVLHCINLNILEDVLDRFKSKYGENGIKRRSAFMSEDKNIILNKEAEL